MTLCSFKVYAKMQRRVGNIYTMVQNSMNESMNLKIINHKDAAASYFWDNSIAQQQPAAALASLHFGLLADTPTAAPNAALTFCLLCMFITTQGNPHCY